MAPLATSMNGDALPQMACTNGDSFQLSASKAHLNGGSCTNGSSHVSSDAFPQVTCKENMNGYSLPPHLGQEDIGVFLQSISQKLVKYVASGPDLSQPVVKLTSPSDMEAAFEEAGTSLELADVESTTPLHTLSNVMDTTLDLSVRTEHPYFLNQLFGAADPIGIAADWAVVAANTAVHTYEVAPVFTIIEQKVLHKIARCVGGRFSESHEGLFVPGGSVSNIYSLHLARAWKVPEFNRKGMAGGPRLVAFTSAQSHYSYKKAAMLLGLGSDNLVGIHCDAKGALLADELEAAILQAKADGDLPFFVGATAGTTVAGAFDPFNAIADICDRHSLWLHVDGAWGGSVMFSSNKQVRSLLDGAGRADSFSWNGHKQMGMPLQCSAFLTSHVGALKSCNGTCAAYLFQPDKLYAEHDLGDKTIQCGRRADAYKLWFFWKAVGDRGMAARVDHCLELAAHFEHKIRDSQGVFVLALPRTYANVCFWYVPASLRPWDPTTASNEARAEMGRVAVRIKATMQKVGLAMIGFQPLDDLPNFFRIVFPSCFHTTKHDLDKLIAGIQKIGDSL